MSESAVTVYTKNKIFLQPEQRYNVVFFSGKDNRSLPTYFGPRKFRFFSPRSGGGRKKKRPKNNERTRGGIAQNTEMKEGSYAVDGEEIRKKTKEKKTKRQTKIISKKYALFFSVQVFVFFFFRFFFLG